MHNGRKEFHYGRKEGIALWEEGRNCIMGGRKELHYGRKEGIALWEEGKRGFGVELCCDYKYNPLF